MASAVMCEECKRAEPVVASGYAIVALPPAGWVLAAEAAPDASVRHFCGWECLVAYAQAAALIRRAEGGERP